MTSGFLVLLGVNAFANNLVGGCQISSGYQKPEGQTIYIRGFDTSDGIDQV